MGGVVTVNPQSAHYATLDEAAQATCTTIAGSAKGWGHEKGAVIVRAPDGSYQVSSVAPGMHDALDFRARFPQGYTLAGLVHSHPTTEASGQYFSPTDVQTAKRLGVPSYIQFDATDQCRKYIPGKTKETWFSDTPDSVYQQEALGAKGDPLTLPAQQPTASAAPSVPTTNTNPISPSKG